LFTVGTNSVSAQPSWTWSLRFYSDSDFTAEIAGAIRNWRQNAELLDWGITENGWTWDQTGSGGVTESSTIYWKQQLQDDAFVEQDSGNGTATFSSAAGIGRYIQAIAQAEGGLTDTQATQLANASDNSDTNLDLWSTFTSVTLPSLQDVLNGITAAVTTFVQTTAGPVVQTLAQIFQPWSLDALFLHEITDGPTSDQVIASDIGVWYAIIVRLTTIPANLVPITPDEAYYIEDLAVLTVYRGSDVWIRAPIHQATRLVENGPLFIAPFFAGWLLSIPPGGINLQVDWKFGAAGQVYVLNDQP